MTGATIVLLAVASTFSGLVVAATVGAWAGWRMARWLIRAIRL